MAVYNHLDAIAEIVSELFNIPKDMDIIPQVHASASAKIIARVGGINYNIYCELFKALADTDEYDAIKGKQFYEQTPAERVLMQCQRAEANLYIYYLLPKLKKLDKNQTAFSNINMGKGGLGIEDLDKIEDLRDKYLDDAYEILDTVDFELGDYGVNQKSGFTAIVTDTREYVYDIEVDEE